MFNTTSSRMITVTTAEEVIAAHNPDYKCAVAAYRTLWKMPFVPEGHPARSQYMKVGDVLQKISFPSDYLGTQGATMDKDAIRQSHTQEIKSLAVELADLTKGTHLNCNHCEDHTKLLDNHKDRIASTYLTGLTDMTAREDILGMDDKSDEKHKETQPGTSGTNSDEEEVDDAEARQQ